MPEFFDTVQEALDHEVMYRDWARSVYERTDAEDRERDAPTSGRTEPPHSGRQIAPTGEWVCPDYCRHPSHAPGRPT